MSEQSSFSDDLACILYDCSVPVILQDQALKEKARWRTKTRSEGLHAREKRIEKPEAKGAASVNGMQNDLTVSSVAPSAMVDKIADKLVRSLGLERQAAGTGAEAKATRVNNQGCDTRRDVKRTAREQKQPLVGQRFTRAHQNGSPKLRRRPYGNMITSLRSKRKPNEELNGPGLGVEQPRLTNSHGARRVRKRYYCQLLREKLVYGVIGCEAIAYYNREAVEVEKVIPTPVKEHQSLQVFTEEGKVHEL
ncbi:uncharacterized protein BDR25DRAFT_351313 [Lindgomyces ingoldianus]|uniref:Uncharacterized protein n=1 Tax=Lindgomyces ingoldianus TaxID=673940 RepID=A0ACB6R6B7_9PLEO|nr:uncharacterized protein BDR25DRAFT_351313 [Lindgomyces ingoldianus]KAF2474808.1 hypothetical protein BDR25DRAFT_351313 [Lindgomyces ingoldianus]